MIFSDKQIVDLFYVPGTNIADDSFILFEYIPTDVTFVFDNSEVFFVNSEGQKKYIKTSKGWVKIVQKKEIVPNTIIHFADCESTNNVGLVTSVSDSYIKLKNGDCVHKDRQFNWVDTDILLEYAKNKYPKNTIFIPAGPDTKKPHLVNSLFLLVMDKPFLLDGNPEVSPIIICNTLGAEVYYNGWANKIDNNSPIDLDMFKIGTYLLPLNNSCVIQITNDKDFYIYNEKSIYWGSKKIYNSGRCSKILPYKAENMKQGDKIRINYNFIFNSLLAPIYQIKTDRLVGKEVIVEKVEDDKVYFRCPYDNSLLYMPYACVEKNAVDKEEFLEDTPKLKTVFSVPIIQLFKPKPKPILKKDGKQKNTIQVHSKGDRYELY
jgi:hypothetical protein